MIYSIRGPSLGIDDGDDEHQPNAELSEYHTETHREKGNQIVPANPASYGTAPASVSLASVEDQTALFEDILHPEMMEALDSLSVSLCGSFCVGVALSGSFLSVCLPKT